MKAAFVLEKDFLCALRFNGTEVLNVYIMHIHYGSGTNCTEEFGGFVYMYIVSDTWKKQCYLCTEG